MATFCVQAGDYCLASGWPRRILDQEVPGQGWLLASHASSHFFCFSQYSNALQDAMMEFAGWLDQFCPADHSSGTQCGVNLIVVCNLHDQAAKVDVRS